MATNERPWLIWDGTCGFCCWCVEWARKRGADDRFRIAAYQDAPSPPMTDALRAEAGRSVLVLYPDGRKLRTARAVLAVLRVTGWSGAAAVLRIPPFLWLMELGYRIVANNRPFFSKIRSSDPAACRGVDSDSEGASCGIPGRPAR
jgi:predicted DCC family thiol-disulfide oxidoreductase YuxK